MNIGITSTKFCKVKRGMHTSYHLVAKADDGLLYRHTKMWSTTKWKASDFQHAVNTRGYIDTNHWVPIMPSEGHSSTRFTWR